MIYDDEPYVDAYEVEQIEAEDRAPLGDGLVEPETDRRYRELGLGPITSGVHISTRSGRAAPTAARVTRTPGGSHAGQR